MAIPREKLEQVGEYLRGTCKLVGHAVDAFDLGDVDETQLEVDLLEVDTEICVGCHWWHEVCDLDYIEHLGGGLCDDCKESEGIED